MKVGDATWHYVWALHSARGNESRTTREVMTIIYFAAGARVTGTQNKHQEADRRRWLCDLQPGDVAASPLNPLIA